MMLFNKNKSVFDKINDYLMKRGHELCLSIYLNEYNGNNIYIRFDYVRKLSVYKVVWVDLNYFNDKNVEDYINMQLVTKFLSLSIVEKMRRVETPSDCVLNESILGDRVEILSYFKEEPREYIFDRFIPLEWGFLADPLAMIFAYLPRSMEIFLNEMFAKFDGNEDRYNYLKPVKFDILNGKYDELFTKEIIKEGTSYYKDSKVKFLEKIENKYIALVEGLVPSLVMIQEVKEDFVTMLCTCKYDYYCKHIYATILAIRNEKYNNFYKVRYIGKEESLLEKITIGSFYMSCGINKDKIMLVTENGEIHFADLVQKGKVVFEVIEDDDDCTLSKQIKNFKIK